MSSSKRINALLFLSILTLTIFGAGCTGKIGDGPEEQTALGCNKAQARYFNPRTGKCVAVTSEQQAYILDQYRYLAEYVQKDDPKLTREFQISFAREFKPDELFKIMEALPEAKISYIGMSFANDRSIGPRLNPPVSMAEMSTAAVKDIEDLNGQPDPVLEKDVTDKNYTVWDLRVIDTAEHLLKWWTAHQDDITVVEPRVNELDKIKSGIRPWEVEKRLDF